MATSPKQARSEVQADPTTLKPERVQLCAALAELPGWAIVDAGQSLERVWPVQAAAELTLGLTVSIRTYVDPAGAPRGARLTVSPQRDVGADLVELARSLAIVTDHLVAGG